MKELPRLGPLLVTSVATVAIAALLALASGVSVRVPATASSELRLSWRARPERIEECKRLTDDELAARPAHMRQRVVCEGIAASYDLRVLIDGRVVDSAIVRGAGLRNDRPLFLLREYAVAPGARAVRVTLERREQPRSVTGDSLAPARGGEETRDAREELQRRGQRLAALPARLEFSQDVIFRAGEAALVTVDRGMLVLVTR